MLLQWPLRLPVIITRNFWFQDSAYYLGVHYAIDIVRMWGYATHLADVIAPGDGQAMAVPWYDQYRGHYVIWAGPNAWRMHVAHLASFAVPMGVWLPVKQGDLLGYADSTGLALGDHAHMDWIAPEPRGTEAVWKAPLGGYVHDVSKWINVDLGWPKPVEEDDMKLLKVFSGSTIVARYIVGPLGRRGIDENEMNAYFATGVAVMDCDQAFADKFQRATDVISKAAH